MAKSNVKIFGQLLAKSKNRTVIQLWTDKFKIGKYLKATIIKATKEEETPIKPDEKSQYNTLSCDTNENIFVIRGMNNFHFSVSRNIMISKK